MNTLIVDYLPSLLSLSGLMIVSLFSPGPDFAVVVRNSLIYSRKTALLTALGIALGILVHVSYILFGLGMIIRESAWLFLTVKYLGAGYLLYIGYKQQSDRKARTRQLIQIGGLFQKSGLFETGVIKSETCHRRL